jgi:hypothetical protein
MRSRCRHPMSTPGAVVSGKSQPSFTASFLRVLSAPVEIGPAPLLAWLQKRRAFAASYTDSKADELKQALRAHPERLQAMLARFLETIVPRARYPPTLFRQLKGCRPGSASRCHLSHPSCSAWPAFVPGGGAHFALPRAKRVSHGLASRHGAQTQRIDNLMDRAQVSRSGARLASSDGGGAKTIRRPCVTCWCFSPSVTCVPIGARPAFPLGHVPKDRPHREAGYVVGSDSHAPRRHRPDAERTHADALSAGRFGSAAHRSAEARIGPCNRVAPPVERTASESLEFRTPPRVAFVASVGPEMGNPTAVRALATASRVRSASSVLGIMSCLSIVAIQAETPDFV